MIAPEPYLSACLEVLYEASLKCRVWGWSGEVPAEQLADLADAIHNIPHFLNNWERCTDVEGLIRLYLFEYQQKWSQRGGRNLCNTFDRIVAKHQKGGD